MSAVLKPQPRLEPMRETDLAEVVTLENALYTHPWTHGNFADSLRAGYRCFTWRIDAELAGYFVLFVAAGEAHLLNLSVAERFQRRGFGGTLLREVLRMAREGEARQVFLEVRPSNRAGQALYERFGFRRVSVRRDYYPAHGGREDALVLSLAL